MECVKAVLMNNISYTGAEMTCLNCCYLILSLDPGIDLNLNYCPEFSLVEL